MKKILYFLTLLLSLSLFGCSLDNISNTISQATTIPEQTTTQTEITTTQQTTTTTQVTVTTTDVIAENGSYSSSSQVALYLHTYGKLPSNFITKNAAEALGWVSSEGNLWSVTDHKSIGGDIFTNREGLLPTATGRIYYECDINYNGGYRGAERIVFSSDGLIYYTNDHYVSYTELYGRD